MRRRTPDIRRSEGRLAFAGTQSPLTRGFVRPCSSPYTSISNRRAPTALPSRYAGIPREAPAPARGSHPPSVDASPRARDVGPDHPRCEPWFAGPGTYHDPIADRPRKRTGGFLNIQTTEYLHAAIRARSGSENKWNGRANPPQTEGAEVADPRTKGTPTGTCPTMKHKSRLLRPARVFRAEAGPGHSSF